MGRIGVISEFPRSVDTQHETPTFMLYSKVGTQIIFFLLQQTELPNENYSIGMLLPQSEFVVFIF